MVILRESLSDWVVLRNMANDLDFDCDFSRTQETDSLLDPDHSSDFCLLFEEAISNCYIDDPGIARCRIHTDGLGLDSLFGRDIMAWCDLKNSPSAKAHVHDTFQQSFTLPRILLVLKIWSCLRMLFRLPRG
jgi:hypothetical protein